MNSKFLPLFLWLFVFFIGCSVFNSNYVAAPFLFPPGNSSLGKIDTVWQISTFNGDSIEFATLRGKKVFAHFWATWCSPCVAEMPHLQALYNDKKQDSSLIFLFFCIEEKEIVQSFMTKNKYTFPIYISKKTPHFLQTGFIPSTFIFNTHGELAYKRVGEADWRDSSVTKFIDALP